MTVKYLEPVMQGNLLFAKVKKLSGVKHGQRRDCFRLKTAMPILVERQPQDGKKKQAASSYKADESKEPYLHNEPRISTDIKDPINPKDLTDINPLQQSQTLNLSDGGVALVTNEHYEIGEMLTLTIDLCPAETLEGIVLRKEKSAVDGYKHSISLQFLHKCKKQKERIYKFIVKQQRSIIKKQAKKTTNLMQANKHDPRTIQPFANLGKGWEIP